MLEIGRENFQIEKENRRNRFFLYIWLINFRWKLQTIAVLSEQKPNRLIVLKMNINRRVHWVRRNVTTDLFKKFLSFSTISTCSISSKVRSLFQIFKKEDDWRNKKENLLDLPSNNVSIVPSINASRLINVWSLIASFRPFNSTRSSSWKDKENIDRLSIFWTQA